MSGGGAGSWGRSSVMALCSAELHKAITSRTWAAYSRADQVVASGRWRTRVSPSSPGRKRLRGARKRRPRDRMVSAAPTGSTDDASNPHSAQCSGGAITPSRLLFDLDFRHPVDEVSGQQVVVVVTGRELAPASCEGAQVDGVTEDLRRRDEGGDRLLALARIFASLYSSPPGVEVAHDVALIGGRHRD